MNPFTRRRIKIFTKHDVSTKVIIQSSLKALLAGSGDNFRDNVEQVVVANPDSGNRSYKIQVTHKGSLDESFRAFSLDDGGAFNFGTTTGGNSLEKPSPCTAEAART